MGRTSKFSFPMPSRRRELDGSKSMEEPAQNGLNLSKAQRFFGTESDLNIDSPTRDEDGTWHSKSSGAMSIIISETTEDSNDRGDESDSDILPARVLYGRASSTLLGRRYNGSGASVRDLKSEASSSTLKSYYDRQKTPLAVSQQTSASSARDLALRKGQPTVASPRSPLMQIDFPGVVASLCDRHVVKKKPTRLDLSKLMSMPRRIQSDPSINSSESFNQRKSAKSNLAKHRKISNPIPTELNIPQTPTRLPKADRKVDFERISRPMPAPHTPTIIRTPRPQLEPQIPPRRRQVGQRQQIAVEEPKLQSKQWDNGSASSKSSLNTKSSKRSAFSVSDLRTTSVLSLSSDDDTDREAEPAFQQPREIQPNRSSPKSRRPTSQIVENTPNKTKSSTQDGQFLTVPLPPPGSSRLSGPWAPDSTKETPGRRSSAQLNKTHRLSKIITIEPTPPLSPPSSLELTERSVRNSRLMAVTKQEEALLEALRKKRARMREKIIAEHEIRKSPPRINPEIVARAVTALGTPFKERKATKGKERILLYLDTPLAERHAIETAEPSPDLSDFLSFGSDDEDDYTPRTSFIKSNDFPRPDSMASPVSKGDRTPVTPQSDVRLSAVGAGSFAVEERKRQSVMSFLDSTGHDIEDVGSDGWSV